MVPMPCDHHPITSQLGLTYNTLLKALRGLKMGGWRIWWIYNRLLYWFRFGFGKVIRVWWHSFNSSDSFPIGFSKIFQISVRSFDIIHLMSDENFDFRTNAGIQSDRWKLTNLILEEVSGKRLWNNLQSAGNAFSSWFYWWCDYMILTVSIMIMVRFPPNSSHHLLINPLIL